MKNILRIIYVVLGFFFIVLGAIGIVIPVLPTTPFLLLSLYFFSRGSKKFEQWFIKTKLYKKYLADFVKSRSMTLKSKIQLLVFASIMLLISAYFVKIIYVRLFIGFLIIYKYYYFIFKIKTVKPIKEAGNEDEITCEKVNYENQI